MVSVKLDLMDDNKDSELLDTKVLLEMLDPQDDGKVSLDRLSALASNLKREAHDRKNTVRRAVMQLLIAAVILAIIVLTGIFSFIHLEHDAYEVKIASNNMLKANIEQALPLEFVIDDILELTSEYDAELHQIVNEVYQNYSNQTLWHQLESNGFVSGYAFKNPWIFESAAWFIFSVMTTIGYGQIVPNTSKGYLLVIVYSIPAIIAMGYFIKQLVDFYKSCPCKPVSVKVQAMTIPILFAIYLAVSGWLFSICEGWTVTESVYFAWVTISTIGFGDFAIGDQNWYQIVAILFSILNGLFVFSYVLNVVGNIAERMANPERWQEAFNSKKMHKLKHSVSISLVKRLAHHTSLGTIDSGSGSSSSIEGGTIDDSDYAPYILDGKLFL